MAIIKLSREFIAVPIPKKANTFEICENMGTKPTVKSVWWNCKGGSCDFHKLGRGRFEIVGIAEGELTDILIIKKITNGKSKTPTPKGSLEKKKTR